jgi:hypothetical protein
MAKLKKPNDRRFVETRAWLTDLMASHSEDIKRNTFKHVSMKRFEDVDFLVKMVEGLTKGNLGLLRSVGIPEEAEEAKESVAVESEDLVAA